MAMKLTRLIHILGLAALAPQLPAANTFNWHGRLAAGQTVEIKGVNGFVHAGRASGGEVEIAALKTARHSDPASVRIEVLNTGHGITVCAVYPSAAGSPNECRSGSGGRMNTRNNDVKVDFTVRIPSGVHFTGRTVNGEIEAASLNGNVEAYTVNGKVRISTAGSAQAHTVNGSITASIGAPSPDKPLAFHTVNGGITVDLPASASARVDAATVNGHISTDFPLTIRGMFTGRHISGSIGRGGSDLTLKTVNGSIELRRV